jgi:hypothetical protein
MGISVMVRTFTGGLDAQISDLREQARAELAAAAAASTDADQGEHRGRGRTGKE